MARKNIFQIIADNSNFTADIVRISRLVDDNFLIPDICISGKWHGLFEFVQNYCFDNWKNKGHFLNVNDFLTTINYLDIISEAPKNTDVALTYIEVIYNFWVLAYHCPGFNHDQNSNKDFHLLRKIMDDVLAQLNHIAYNVPDLEQVWIVENKPEATALAEVISPKLAPSIIRYNHHLLKGDIDAKKAILLALGDDLEPKRKELDGIDSKLSSNIFFMLNNMNIRHNNITMGDKNYKQSVAEMDKTDLENWYDELYQMILLANLLIDNKARTAGIQKLKTDISTSQ